MAMYDHLAAPAKEVIEDDVDDRISYVYRDRLIRFDQFNAVIAELDHLLHYPRQIRMPCALLIGPTGIGKTKAITAFLRMHPSEGPSVGPGTTRIQPVLVIQMPPEPTQPEILYRLLDGLNAPAGASATSRLLERTLVKILRDLGVALIIIDEFHNLNSSTARQRQIVINVLKNLTNTTQIPIVAVGTGAAQMTVKYDDQMAHRFRLVEMRPFSLGAQFDQFVRTVVAHLPLKRSSELDSSDFRKCLFSLTGGVTVNLLRVLSDAAVVAMQSGTEQLTVDLLSRLSPPLLSVPTAKASARTIRLSHE